MTILAQPTDAELVIDSLSGHQDAFETIIQKYQSLVCSLTYSATGDFQISEDIAQSTFVTAWRDLSKLDDPTKLKSWLCSVARHQSADCGVKPQDSDRLRLCAERPQSDLPGGDP